MRLDVDVLGVVGTRIGQLGEQCRDLGADLVGIGSHLDVHAS